MSGARTDFAVIGGGRWAVALAHVAARGGQSVRLYVADSRRRGHLQRKRQHKSLVPELERLHEGVRLDEDLSETMAASHTVLLACAAGEVRAMTAAIGPHVDGAHVVLHAVRGLEPETLRRASRVIREECCARKVGALLGPAVVSELVAGRPNAFVCASRFPEVVQRARDAFVSPSVRVYHSSDLRGVEVSAAAASVGALGIGFIMEQQMGPATLAMMVSRGVAEMSRVVEAAGGKSSSAMGLAGLGELMAHREIDSREVRGGRMLARGKNAAQIERELGALDALGTARAFQSLASRLHVPAHIASVVADLVDGLSGVDEALTTLMSLAQMEE